MIKKGKKENLIKEMQIHETDTGSAEVQVGLLSENIQKTLGHLKKNPKDIHSKQGLLKMVIKRKRLLKYLEKKSPKKYSSIIKKIGLKK